MRVSGGQDAVVKGTRQKIQKEKKGGGRGGGGGEKESREKKILKRGSQSEGIRRGPRGRLSGKINDRRKKTEVGRKRG